MKKRDFVRPVYEEKIFKEATEKYNEITVVKRVYDIYIPFGGQARKEALKVIKPYTTQWNNNRITLWAKTERHKEDEYDQDLGVKIARAKVERKLWKIILRINDCIFNEHLREYIKLEKREEFLINCISRENKYIEKLCNK